MKMQQTLETKNGNEDLANMVTHPENGGKRVTTKKTPTKMSIGKFKETNDKNRR